MTTAEDRFVEYSLSVEWFLDQDATPSGTFEVILPKCFAKSITVPKIEITEISDIANITVTACITDFFFDCLCRNGFIFKLKYVDRGYSGTVQLDGSPLLLKGIYDTSVTESFGNFTRINFTVSADSKTFDSKLASEFSPAFIHLTGLRNFPRELLVEEPIIRLRTGLQEFNVRINDIEFDTVISILYRKETTLNFEIESKNGRIIECNYGSGKETDDEVMGDQAYVLSGHGSFELLPARTESIPIKGTGFNSNVFMEMEIIDTVTDFKPISKERGPITRPAVEKTKEVGQTQTGKKKGQLSTKQQSRIQSLEGGKLQYHRWIVTATRDDNGWSSARKLMDVVTRFNEDLFEAKHIGIKGRSYAKCIKKVPNLVTGFHMETPQEQIIILETRADVPNHDIESCIKSFQRSVHAIGNKRIKFPAPRLYCLFDEPVKEIPITIPVGDMLRLNGLYFQNSANSKFFPIFMKLNSLMGCENMADATESSIFPTYDELQLMISTSELFYSMPFQNGMAAVPVKEKPGCIKFDVIFDEEKDTGCNTNAYGRIGIPEVASSVTFLPRLLPLTEQPTRRRLTVYSLKGTESLTTFAPLQPHLPTGTAVASPRHRFVQPKFTVHEPKEPMPSFTPRPLLGTAANKDRKPKTFVPIDTRQSCPHLRTSHGRRLTK